MDFSLNQPLADGNTPIRPEEAAQLIPRISTQAELNEYEAANILVAREWAFSKRTMKSTEPIDEGYVRKLHSKMFDQVWKWAGTYRKHDVYLGCDPTEILQRLPQLIDNTKYWLENKTFPIDECLIRFHHKLVGEIHPFVNGNGRHARLIVDVAAVKLGEAEFTWGANAHLVDVGPTRVRYLAALRALDANQHDVRPLLEFARS